MGRDWLVSTENMFISFAVQGKASPPKIKFSIFFFEESAHESQKIAQGNQSFPPSLLPSLPPPLSGGRNEGAVWVIGLVIQMSITSYLKRSQVRLQGISF